MVAILAQCTIGKKCLLLIGELCFHHDYATNVGKSR